MSEVSFESIQDTIIDIQDTLIIATTSGMNNYLWSDGSSADSLEFIASQYGIGIHTVTVTAFDSLNCLHSDTIIIEVENLVSIGELGLTLEMTIFPNPSTGIIKFSMKEIDFVEIFTLEGKKLGQLVPNDGIIDLSGFQSGFYLLKVASNRGTQIIKVLKEDS